MAVRNNHRTAGIHKREYWKAMSMDPTLCLYNLTLQRQTASLKSCIGNFSGKKAQEIITATSNSLTVYKADTSTGKLASILTVQIFAIVRSIANFKIAGSGKDYLALTSDAGNLSILELDLTSGKFIPLFNEPYFKSGIRRLSPGAELAVDPKGRALLANAIERNKLVYVFNRDLDNSLTISSPLEANRSKILTFAIVGLDVGYENPLFAAIETDYSEYEYDETTHYDRVLTYYELDLGLNNVLRKHYEKVDSTANYLLQVPGGADGPSGVIVCAKNLVSYRNLQGDKLSIAIPKRQGSDQDALVITGVVHKMKNQYFFLIQTNLGDVFKVELEEGQISISYFDTLPTCSSLIILKSGFLYADTEYGDKQFYQFEKLGSENPFTSTVDIPTKELRFSVNEELDNLLLVDVVESLNPILDAKLVNDDAFTKIYALANYKESAALRVLQYGLSISEIVESDLPGIASDVWTCKIRKDDELDKYLIISFMDSTLVLSIGESVEEVTDSGLSADQKTLNVQQIGEGSIVQIMADGIRQVKNGQFVTEWLPPAGIKILTSSATNRQIAVGLSNNELVYFEIDSSDRMVEYSSRKEIQDKIISLSLGDIPEGRLRSDFLVVGCQDSTIRVLSLSLDSPLESLSLQALSSVPTDLLILSMNNQLFVNIGLENGVYVRTLLDEHTGQLSDTRTKYLGNKPIRLSKVIIGNDNVVLAFSNKTWVITETKNGFKINSLLVDPLRSSAIFNSDECTNGIVGVYKRKLKIFSIGDLEHDFQIDSIKLQTTPRHLVKFDKSIFVAESSSDGNFVQEINSEDGEIQSSIQIDEKILAIQIVNFTSKDQTLLIVSTASTDNLFSLKVFDLKLNFIHQTKIPASSHTMVEFQGRLLIGMKDCLRMFDIGLKQLLSKATTKIESLSEIVRLDTQGLRVVVGDIKESVTFVVYKPSTNEFLLFVDDYLQRHITSLKMVDYDTVITGDKFGNLSLLRIDEETSEIAKNPTFLSTQEKVLNGAPYKLNNLCNFHIEDIPMSLQKGSFTVGGKDIILYTGIQGTIGVLIPLITRADIKFFHNLQRAMRSNVKDLTERMNVVFRGYYSPVKDVIDGDLIELFNSLAIEVQIKIANEIDKTPREVAKKIYEIRSLSV